MQALQAQHAEAQPLLGGGEPRALPPPAPASGMPQMARPDRRGPPTRHGPHGAPSAAVAPFVRARSQGRAQRALSVRLGEEIQALPRRAGRQSVSGGRARGGGGAARCGRPGADRAAAGRQAHGGLLGVSRRQDRPWRERRAGAARASWPKSLAYRCSRCHPLLQLRHDYADRVVELEVFVVDDYQRRARAASRPRR